MTGVPKKLSLHINMNYGIDNTNYKEVVVHTHGSNKFMIIDYRRNNLLTRILG